MSLAILCAKNKTHYFVSRLCERLGRNAQCENRQNGNANSSHAEARLGATTKGKIEVVWKNPTGAPWPTSSL
jgi:hypothetical protein